LAYLAARLVAEGGAADYELAKQKAARQAGISELRLLPDNREVEEALRDYQGLYQREEQQAQLRNLRRIAAMVMRELSAFRPYLVGSVLNGTANRHSRITLQLFVDDAKVVSLFLLNSGRAYTMAEKHLKVGERWSAVPQFLLDVDGAEVTLSVYSPTDERSSSRTRTHGEPLARADLTQVEALLTA
jgi:hypothetical protein